MKPAISVITLGVTDFSGSYHFYRDKLGWHTSSSENDDIAFFQLRGTILALYGRDKLSEDSCTEATDKGIGAFTLAQNATSEEEVTIIIEELRKSGVRIIKEPQKAFWGGFSAYFADPDGNPWEIVYNPFWKVDADGMVSLDQ